MHTTGLENFLAALPSGVLALHRNQDPGGRGWTQAATTQRALRSVSLRRIALFNIATPAPASS